MRNCTSCTDSRELVVDKQCRFEQARWGDIPSTNCKIIISGDTY